MSSTANAQAVKLLMQQVSNDVTFANGEESARDHYIKQLNNLFSNQPSSHTFQPGQNLIPAPL
jgi:hypothetical protein